MKSMTDAPAAPLPANNQGGQADQKILDLEREKIGLDRYKAKLDFWKFVLGSVFAAIAIATIPPSFQFATAYWHK